MHVCDVIPHIFVRMFGNISQSGTLSIAVQEDYFNQFLSCLSTPSTGWMHRMWRMRRILWIIKQVRKREFTSSHSTT